MLVLTEDAKLVCEHETGKVENVPSQKFCTIAGRRILVHDDPEGRSISRCSNVNFAIGMRACLHTLKVKEGYSEFVRIGGHRLCLSSLYGLTDGTPPGLVRYIVRDPGQTLVRST